MARQLVKVMEGRVVYDEHGKPSALPGRLLKTFSVSGDGPDQRLEAAKEETQRLTGRLPAMSVTTEVDPGTRDHVIVATVRAK